MQIGTLSCESKALAYLHDSCDTLSFEPQFATSLRQQKAEKWTPINTSAFLLRKALMTSEIHGVRH